MKRRTIAIGVAVFLIIGLGLLLSHGALAVGIASAVGTWQNEIVRRMPTEPLPGPQLVGVAFAGGLVASISPCIISMLPLNLSYIGAARFTTRRQALSAAAMFVAGVGAVNVVLGLVSSLFFSVFTEHRAEMNIGVGLLTIIMALWYSGLLRIPTPQFVNHISKSAGSFCVGVLFALVVSPCASPVLVTVLAMAARDGKPYHSVLAMVAYTAGYTALLFAAAIFAGVAVASRRLLTYGPVLTKTATVALSIIGLWMTAYGVSLL